MRIFNNNPLFIIKFKIIYKCIGICKFKNETIKDSCSLPYLNLDENKFKSDRNKSLDDKLFKDIFESRSKIWDQKECFLYNKFILNINYSDIILPKISILNCDMGIFKKVMYGCIRESFKTT